MDKRPKDTLFNINTITEDFVFSERVVEVFDDMLDRSIPFYSQVIEATALLLDSFLLDGDKVVDLGCATGTTLLELSRLLQSTNIHFLGVDNSQPMLDKGRLKSELYSKQDRISFQLDDITEFDTRDVGAIILNYTMQFIRPVLRERFLKQIFTNLRPGGICILSEKTITHDPLLNRRYIEIYHQFKRKKGYSELEIAKKREALENILIPFSIEENRSLLQKVGFSSTQTFFQWFNFTSFIAAKPL